MMPSLGISDTKFIVPTAKSRSITINMGSSMPGWFDIYDLDENSPEDTDGFADSTRRINHFIQSEIDKGVSPQRIVVGGFSQGGAVALHTTLRSSHSLGGCIALSTWLPFRDQYPKAMSTAASNLRVLQVHGDEDQVVSFNWGSVSFNVIKTMLSNPAPEFIKIEGMGHSSDPEEMMQISLFLRSVFRQ
jgi:lysophospholipase-2